MILSAQLPLSGITIWFNTVTEDVDVTAEVDDHIVITEALLSGPIGKGLFDVLSGCLAPQCIHALGMVDTKIAYDIVEVEREESMKRMAT